MLDLAQLREDLSRDEGRVPHAYADSLGYLTIGVGHLIDPRLGGRLPDMLIDALLDYDISLVCAELDDEIPWWRSLSEPRQRALVNMCFNLGWPRLRLFRKMLAALQAGDYDRAATEALDSTWSRQVGKRSQRLADALRGRPGNSPLSN